jgi:predicted pyridoxine 5'-phosphate oxidase superfamily flavin-nucleotide-binding protein
MAAKLNKEIIALFGSDDSTKVLATVNEQGEPHAVAKPFIRVDEEGNLLYLELVESSRTQKNLVRSIWFDQKVSVSVSNRKGQSWQIKGKPVRTLITGPVFLQHYRDVRRRLGDVDLSAVWVIEPDEVINENSAVRQAEEEQAHPLFRHLDRLAKVQP